MPAGPRDTESASLREAFASFTIPEGGADGARRVNDFAVGFDELHFFQGLVERHRSHFTGFEADHAAELTLGDEVGSSDAEACAEDAVERSGRAAALDVTRTVTRISFCSISRRISAMTFVTPPGPTGGIGLPWGSA